MCSGIVLFLPLMTPLEIARLALLLPQQWEAAINLAGRMSQSLPANNSVLCRNLIATVETYDVCRPFYLLNCSVFHQQLFRTESVHLLGLSFGGMKCVVVKCCLLLMQCSRFPRNCKTADQNLSTKQRRRYFLELFVYFEPNFGRYVFLR